MFKLILPKLMMLLLFAFPFLFSSCILGTTEKTSSSEDTSEKESYSESISEKESQTEKATGEHIHVFSDWVIAIPSACEKSGVQTRNCTCGYTESAALPAPYHELVHHDAVAVSCYHDGISAYDSCLHCGYTTPYTVTPTEGHTIITRPSVAATCLTDGFSAFGYCTKCDYQTEKTVFKATGHSLASFDEVAATCTQVGKKAYEKCTVCTYSTETPAETLGHDFVFESGSFHCTRCTYTPFSSVTSDMTLTVNPTSAENVSAGVFTTLSSATETALTLLSGGTVKNVTVRLSEGYHYVPEEIVLDGTSLPADATLTFVGDDGNTVSSEYRINGSLFTKVAGKNYYSYQLPETLKNQNGTYPEFRDISVGGVHYDMARSASGVLAADTAQSGILYVRPSVLTNLPTDSDGYFLVADADGKPILDKGGNTVRTNVEIWLYTQWQLQNVRLVRVLPITSDRFENGEALVPVVIEENDAVTFYKAYSSVGSIAGRTYFFLNSLSYLDTPGEFYYDTVNGVLYICPEGDISDLTVGVPMAERLFALSDIENVRFENLCLTGATSNFVFHHGYMTGQCGYLKSDYTGAAPTKYGFIPTAAIYGENVKNITVYNCTVNNTGYDAVAFVGAVENITVANCTLHNIGACAVRIGRSSSQYDDTVYNKNIVITNNDMFNTAAFYASSPAVFVASVNGLDLSHNSIVYTSYSAISVGFSWTRRDTADPAVYDADTFVNIKHAMIYKNYIESFMTILADGGAIYTLGGNATMNMPLDDVGNQIFDNYIVVTPKTHNGLTLVLYHDGASSHWRDTGNVVQSLPGSRTMSRYLYYQSISSQQATRIHTDSFTVVRQNGALCNYSVPLSPNEYDLAISDYVVYASLSDIPNDARGNAVKQVTENAGCSFAEIGYPLQ